MAFAVVKFKVTNDVSVVPINWIDGDMCFWPPKYLETKVLPYIYKGITASQAWNLYSIKTLGVFATYSDARKKLVVAEEKSDLNTTDPEEQGRGKRPKKKKKLSSSDDSDDTCFLSHHLKEPPVYPVSFERIQTRPNVINLSKGIESLLSSCNFYKDCNKNFVSPKPEESIMNLPTVSNNSKLNQNSELTSLSAFQKTLLRDINIIKSNQKHIIETMGCILKTVGRLEKNKDGDYENYNLIESILILLPVSDINNLNKIEEILNDENACNQMISYLQKVGGSYFQQATKFMLRKIISDDLACSFSLLGIRGKRTFKHLRVCKLIMSAVRSHPLWRDTSDNEIEKVISDWLRHANTRSKKKKIIDFT